MIKVTVADVVETKWRLGMCAVVLFDAEGRRILPVFMGEREATAIALGGRDVQMPRPLTHQFAASLLEAAGGTLEEVCVTSLRTTPSLQWQGYGSAIPLRTWTRGPAMP